MFPTQDAIQQMPANPNMDPATAAILDQRYNDYINSPQAAERSAKFGDINSVRLQGDSPYIRNFNKLMGMGLVGQAYQYLYDNTRAFSYDPTKGDRQGAFGIWQQVAKQIGQGNVSGLINRMGNNAGTGIFDQFKHQNTRNWRAYTGQMEDTTNSAFQQYQNQRVHNGIRGLYGNRSPVDGLGGVNQAARAAGGMKGDYTYSRYDDGMQHLAQMNDPTWTTFGNPNRGAPVGAANPAQAATQQTASAVTQPAPAQVPAAPTGLGGMASSFPSRQTIRDSRMSSGGTPALQPPAVPTAPQVPQAGTEGSFSTGGSLATAPTQTTYTRDPSRFRWGR